jgi:hypothetical protein
MSHSKPPPRQYGSRWLKPLLTGFWCFYEKSSLAGMGQATQNLHWKSRSNLIIASAPIDYQGPDGIGISWHSADFWRFTEATATGPSSTTCNGPSILNLPKW